MEETTYPTDQYVKEAEEKHIPIIDVRDPNEYAQGHIPGAINIPLKEMKTADVKDGSYISCESGYRSELAVLELQRRGIHATDIGGTDFYTGKLVK